MSNLYQLVGIDTSPYDVIAAGSGSRNVFGRGHDGELREYVVTDVQWYFLYWIWRLCDDPSVTHHDVVVSWINYQEFGIDVDGLKAVDF